MAKKGPNINRSRSNPGKKNKQPNAVDFATKAAEAADKQPNIESVKLSSAISEGINDRVSMLISGVARLKAFVESSDQENPQFKEKNQPQIEKLVHMNLQQSYTNLVQTFSDREQFYKEIVQKRVITQPELDQILGKISNQPYTDLINSIKAKPLPNPNPDNLQALTDDDVTNLKAAAPENLETILNTLRHQNKITDDQVTKLKELGPKTEQQIKEARDQIFVKIQSADIANSTNHLAKYKLLLSREKQSIQEIDGYIGEYNTVMRDLVRQIQEMFDAAENQKIRDKVISDLSKASGLPIKKGSVLYGEDWSFEPLNEEVARPRNKKIEITDITFGETDADPDEDPDFQGKVLTFEPVIHFKAEVHNQTGQMVDKKMSASQFLKWLAQNNVAQKIDSLQQLEQELGISGELKPGQSLEFQELKPIPNATSDQPAVEAVDKTVRIESIDPDGINLSEEVYLDDPVPGLRKGRKAKKLNFADFARWYRKNEVIPQLQSLEKLNEQLKKFNQKLEKEIGLDPKSNPPIDLNKSKPILLLSAYDPEQPPLEIIDTNDQQITFADGSNLPLSKFLRKVMNDGLVVPSPADLEELKNLRETQGEDQKAQQIDDLIKRYPPPAAPASKEVKPKPDAPAKKKGIFSRLKSIWKDTTWLNLKEMYELFIKVPIDKIKDKLKDSSERAVAKVGKEFYKGIPYIGGSLVGKYTAALNAKNAEDVKKIKEGWENEGKTIAQLFGILYGTDDKKQFKAAMEVLADKGVLRFSDDNSLHSALNKLFPGNVYPEKFSAFKGELVVVGKQPKKGRVNPEDQIRILLEKDFGEGYFDGLLGKNKSEYDKRSRSAFDNYRDEEFYGVEKKIGKKLQSMIKDFEEGKGTDPAQFEGYLKGAVQNNEISAEQAIFFFICAFGARNKNGSKTQSLIPINNFNPFFGVYKDNPIFAYFTGSTEAADVDGNLLPPGPDGKRPKVPHFDVNEFRRLYNEVVLKDIQDNLSDPSKNMYDAGKNTIFWLQNEVLTKEKIEKKISQKISVVDQSLYHYVGPLLSSEDEINQLVIAGRGRMDFDVLKNNYVGYNTMLKVRSNRLRGVNDPQERKTRIEQIGKMLTGAIYYDNALQGRLNEDEEGSYYRTEYVNFSPYQYNSLPTADEKRPVGAFARENQSYAEIFVKGLAELAGDGELLAMAQKVFNTKDQLPRKTEREFRKRISNVIYELQETNYDNLVELAEKASNVLTGMSGQQAAKIKKE